MILYIDVKPNYINSRNQDTYKGFFECRTVMPGNNYRVCCCNIKFDYITSGELTRYNGFSEYYRAISENNWRACWCLCAIRFNVCSLAFQSFYISNSSSKLRKTGYIGMLQSL